MTGVTTILGLLASTAVGAQQLTPRAYWPAPNGTKVLTVGTVRSTGDVVLDPSLPIAGIESEIWITQVGYLQTINLAGRTASILANLPLSWGTTEGTVAGVFRSRHLSGLGDLHLRLAVNLVGAPSMDRSGFERLRAAPKPVVGASVEIVAPTGRYESDRVINLGTNRWAIKPAIGAIYPLARTWLVELEVAAWFFGTNDDFLNTTHAQDPMLSGSLHLIKRLRAGFWVSLDTTVYGGGRTTIGDILNVDVQRNSRIGATMVFPFKRRHAIRSSFSTGLVTRSGGDFVNISLSYQFAWN
jgi:hypothetical protein